MYINIHGTVDVQDNTAASWTLYRAVLLQTVHTGTFTQYVWNIAQMMLFNYRLTCPEEMTAPPNLVPFPWDKAPPATPNHAECCHHWVSSICRWHFIWNASNVFTSAAEVSMFLRCRVRLTLSGLDKGESWCWYWDSCISTLFAWRPSQCRLVPFSATCLGGSNPSNTVCYQDM